MAVKWRNKTKKLRNGNQMSTCKQTISVMKLGMERVKRNKQRKTKEEHKKITAKINSSSSNF